MLLGCLLAAVLSAAWCARDWAALSRLRLPDTDDVMRLQQIRDWLAGQAFGDLAQHRLGIGLPMHWSRLADLVPASIIAALTPTLGGHTAELVAVIAWPALLFAAAIALVAQITRALGETKLAATSAVVAAIAYPATTIFIPGRIDHHGLQAVLLLGALLAMVRPASPGAGSVAGLLAAASLVVGMETAPLFAALGFVAVIEWVRSDDRGRLGGLGLGALTGLAIGKGIFAPLAWDYPACDGFTLLAWQAAVVLVCVPVMLAAGGTRVYRWHARAAMAAGAASAAAGVAMWLSPQCLSPYGAVDPLLVRLWLAHVAEAQPLFAAAPATAIGYAGLMTAGLVATVWQVRATRAPLGANGWSVMLMVQLAAAALTLVQLRGAYVGALLAAPGLAAAIAAARARGAVSLMGAWAASAGMLYPLAADAMTPRTAGPSVNDGGACDSPALLASLAALPTGTVIAPIDAGARAIAATRHHLVAAPYHRNGAGNLAVYGFYLGTPAAAQRIAAQWHVDYALACDAMPGRDHLHTMAAALAAGSAPNWRIVARIGDGAAIYALSARGSAH